MPSLQSLYSRPASQMEEMMPSLKKRESSQYKCNLVWRPLIRMFRRYLKNGILPTKSYQLIRAKPLQAQGNLFLEALGLDKSQLPDLKLAESILVLIINSHRVTWRKTLTPEAKVLMGAYERKIWSPFFLIFNETTQRQRFAFFSEPTIRLLWERFVVDNKVEITAYASQMRQQNEATFSDFVKDVSLIEEMTHCRILAN